MKTSVRVFVLLVLAVPAIGLSQVQFQIPIKLVNGSDSTILRLGVNTGNTIGIDTLSALGAYQETMAPPTPPAPFAWDARLVTIPGRVSTFPTGLATGVYTDFRAYVSPSQIDSFKIKIDGDNTDAQNTVVSWQSGLSQFGTAWTIKPQIGTDWPITDMLASTSVTIPPGTQKNIIIIKTGASGVSAVREQSGVLPARYELAQNYPNPFNPSTSIRFSLARAGLIRLTVYTLLGQQVATLANENMSAGEHVIQFDAKLLSSGMYFYRLEASGFIATRTMMLVK